MSGPLFVAEAAIWHFILERLARRERVALLVVAESKGHAPGKPGFKMAVGGDGQLCGSIGGGAIEHDLVEEARAMLKKRRPVASIARKVHELDHRQTSGMICGGSQTVVTYPCRRLDRAAVVALLGCLEAGQPGALALTASGITFTPGRRGGRRLIAGGQGRAWCFTEHLPVPDTVYLLGGGHVALALSRVLATLDFRIVVIDERMEVSTAEWNPHAHERRVLAFSKAGAAIPAGPRSYVVIMTPGHRSDEIALRQLVRKRLRYLGVMASVRKARELLESLHAAGFPPACLARVQTPVGLPIGSHTPAEIAVSIAAQLIQVRNGGAGAKSR
jgi:xanthine dehydrogenase accessory factor